MIGKKDEVVKYRFNEPRIHLKMQRYWQKTRDGILR